MRRGSGGPDRGVPYPRGHRDPCGVWRSGFSGLLRIRSLIFGRCCRVRRRRPCRSMARSARITLRRGGAFALARIEPQAKSAEDRLAVAVPCMAFEAKRPIRPFADGKRVHAVAIMPRAARPIWPVSGAGASELVSLRGQGVDGLGKNRATKPGSRGVAGYRRGVLPALSRHATLVPDTTSRRARCFAGHRIRTCRRSRLPPSVPRSSR